MRTGRQRRLAFGLLALTAASPAAAEPSRLWGLDGERWPDGGRLPDVSWAGYRAGDAPIPDVPVGVRARDHGVRADGTTDDTAALQAALDAAAALVAREGRPVAVALEAGRHRLDGALSMPASGVVLRGVGPDSVLAFTRSLAELRGARPQWSWSGGLLELGRNPRRLGSAEVRSAIRPGMDRVTLTSTAGFGPGDLVQLDIEDDGSGSLGRHLHGEAASAGSCDWQRPYRFVWTTRLAALDGRQAVLAQPSRTELRSAWTVRLHRVEMISELGVEDLAIELPDVPYAGHLSEPGYNAISIVGVIDGWVRRVRIANADNGVLVDGASKHVTIEDLHLSGRRGHHGIQIAFSSDVRVERFEHESDWVHAVTVDHRANGNVIADGGGAFELEMDHHRDAPIQNLWRGLRTPASFRSSGSTCAGPHAGAGNVFWDLAAIDAPPSWGAVPSVLVGAFVPFASQPEAGPWLEPVADLEPAALDLAQRALRHARTSTADRFSDDAELGRRSDLDQARGEWLVWRGALYHRDPESLDGARRPAAQPARHHRLARLARPADGLAARVRLGEVLAWTPDASAALVLDWTGPDDYDAAVVSADSGRAGLWRVRGGVGARLAAATATIADTGWHTLETAKAGGRWWLRLDGVTIADVADPAARPAHARLGVGSAGHAAWFGALRPLRSVLPPTRDAGVLDAAAPDATPPDAGTTTDAGLPDAGPARPIDAGPVTGPEPPTDEGCRCLGPTPPGPSLGLALLLALSLLLRRRPSSG